MSTGPVPGLRVCSIPSHPVPSMYRPPVAYGSYTNGEYAAGHVVHHGGASGLCALPA